MKLKTFLVRFYKFSRLFEAVPFLPPTPKVTFVTGLLQKLVPR